MYFEYSKLKFMYRDFSDLGFGFSDNMFWYFCNLLRNLLRFWTLECHFYDGLGRTNRNCKKTIIKDYGIFCRNLLISEVVNNKKKKIHFNIQARFLLKGAQNNESEKSLGVEFFRCFWKFLQIWVPWKIGIPVHLSGSVWSFQPQCYKILRKKQTRWFNIDRYSLSLFSPRLDCWYVATLTQMLGHKFISRLFSPSARLTQRLARTWPLGLQVEESFVEIDSSFKCLFRGVI